MGRPIDRMRPAPVTTATLPSRPVRVRSVIVRTQSSSACTSRASRTRLLHDVNLLWVVIGAVLVIFMQAGFALVETGFCRAKHAAHVVSTNFAIFGLGFVAYYLVGYGLMFGGYSVPLIGMNSPVGTNLLGSGD